MERTLGVDLASQAAHTGICVIAWESGGARVELVSRGADDATLSGMMAGAAKTGIDAPFGWPEPFVEAVAAHHRLEPWPAGDRAALVRRRTDLFVHERVRKMPMSVSTDRIAYCALRCAALLGDAPRDGSGLVVEAYPDAALRCWLPDAWATPVDSYKGAGAQDRRSLLLSKVVAELGPRFEISEPDQRRCVSSDDCLDALVCALVARAAQRRKTIAPATEDDRRLAKAEGWIHLPAGELGDLL
jgi:predicted nuclease with RNAse H fold